MLAMRVEYMDRVFSEFTVDGRGESDGECGVGEAPGF
jgi:hypothetical protein